MIKIERGPHPTDTLMDKKRAEELERLKDLCAKKQTLKFERLWSKDNKVKKFLHRSQHGKCCYCERRRDLNGEPDIEHFRPKAKVKENPNHLGYWWLAYDWDNLLLSCKQCNQHKSTKFPLKNESKRAFSENNDLRKEEPILINPLTENPEDFIYYHIPQNNERPLMIKALGKCERSNRTINELTGMNKKELLEERARRVADYHIFTDYYHLMENNPKKKTIICEKIREKMQPESQFAGFARFYFSQVGLSDI